MKMIKQFFGCAAALALAACTGGDASNNFAANEAAPADNISAMTSDPSNPYGPAESQMHERMMAATGANASETWVRKMIAHHQGAIAMSEILIRRGGDPQAVAMARRTAEMQRRQIGELEAMLAGDSGAPAGTADASNPAAAPKAARPEAQRPRQPARPTTKEEPVDPHAGHDMANMSR